MSTGRVRSARVRRPRTSALVAATLLIIGACTRNASDPIGTQTQLVPGSASAGCGNEPSPGSRSVTLRHDGIDRVYDIVVPEMAEGVPTAVVLAFHGFDNPSSEQATVSGLGTRSLDEGFIAVFPRGSVLEGTTPTYFNVETIDDPSLADDVGFTSAILDDIEADLCVDRTKIYATGLSNGGAFASTLACELGDRIAAVAPVAAVHILPNCDGRPVPILVTHGTADPLVPFTEADVEPTLELLRRLTLGEGANGSELRMLTQVTSTPVTSWVESWARHNGCSLDAPVVLAEVGIETTTYRDCRDGGDVVLQVVVGGGHDWPAGPELDATAKALEFFWAHSLPAAPH